MKRKHQISSLLLMAVMASGFTAQSQPPVGPGRPGSIAFAGPPPPLQTPGMVALTTLSGTIQQFTANEESILDGFTLTTDSKTIAVHFPSHLGQAIQKANKLNDKVTVTGVSDSTPEGVSVFRMVSLMNGQTVLTDTPPATAPVPITPTPITVKGKVVDYLLNRQGQVNGIRLNDQTLVRVPPHAIAQLMAIVPKESTVLIEGYVHPMGDGQVRLNQHTLVEASVITANGQSFLVR